MLGLISVPLNFRLPGIKQSGYARAIDAKVCMMQV